MKQKPTTSGDVGSARTGAERRRFELRSTTVLLPLTKTRAQDGARRPGDVGSARTGAERRRFELRSTTVLRKKERTVSSILSVFFPEHKTGFEPATLALARRYSTTEPLVHFLLSTALSAWYSHTIHPLQGFVNINLKV